MTVLVFAVPTIEWISWQLLNFFVIPQPSNIFVNRGPVWSAVGRGRLCSIKNLDNRHSLIMTSSSSILMQNKAMLWWNYIILNYLRWLAHATWCQQSSRPPCKIKNSTSNTHYLLAQISQTWPFSWFSVLNCWVFFLDGLTLSKQFPIFFFTKWFMVTVRLHYNPSKTVILPVFLVVVHSTIEQLLYVLYKKILYKL